MKVKITKVSDQRADEMVTQLFAKGKLNFGRGFRPKKSKVMLRDYLSTCLAETAE